jgi:hypothetical protein
VTRRERVYDPWGGNVENAIRKALMRGCHQFRAVQDTDKRFWSLEFDYRKEEKA